MPTKMKFRTVYSARDEEHKGIIFPSDSLAQQHFKQECDVNFIVDRYVKTGEMEHLSSVEPHFADVSDIPTDLFAAYEKVAVAEAAFMDLPSGLRKELNNDPAALSDWLMNPDNRQAAVQYGLISAPVQQEKTNVETNVGSKNDEKPPEA